MRVLGHWPRVRAFNSSNIGVYGVEYHGSQGRRVSSLIRQHGTPCIARGCRLGLDGSAYDEPETNDVTPSFSSTFLLRLRFRFLHSIDRCTSSGGIVCFKALSLDWCAVKLDRKRIIEIALCFLSVPPVCQSDLDKCHCRFEFDLRVFRGWVSGCEVLISESDEWARWEVVFWFG